MSNRTRTLACIVFLLAPAAQAQVAHETVDAGFFENMSWRCIGPYRGGRVTAVTGIPERPLVYYFGATGGGVWKTENAGITWKNISDPYFKTGSVGAIAVAPSNPDVIYVGMGESSLRNDISYGDGVYKSEDSGRTWKHIGLEDSRHISRIRVHPINPDLVYVTALGHVYGPNQQRGVFRSLDGGGTWEKVLYLDEKTGAGDLAMDSHDPDVLYAGMWQVIYTPWGRYSGGPGSGIYKSTDRGDTWHELTEGLPKGEKGRIGIDVSPVNPNRIWALIEADEGGLYRSDNAGLSWQFVSDYIHLTRRHDYYTHIFADTQNEETLYVLTAPFMKSVDGGKSWSHIRVPHGDNHDLWIAPEDNRRMINGNDGGANVSFDGGASWSRQDNQPTAQLYHVTTDTRFPYRVYGAMQDNGTISVSSRGSGSRRGYGDLYSVAGGESGYIAIHPDNPDISYGGSYWGRMTRYDHSTKERRDISIRPELPGGRPGADLKYRFNWTFPILISPHDPTLLYAGANVLFRSKNEGRSWQIISPDLTRNDRAKMRDGKLTHFYGTIFSLSESPRTRGLLWVGSDDGRVHLTRDGGEKWEEVTPESMPEWSRVSIIETSPHDPAKAYLAVNRFDLDDTRPYIYRTDDSGKTWELIIDGIKNSDFLRVVRADPERPGLLYAGSERGVYISFDDGAVWQSLQLNLPAVPVHDLAVKKDELIAATHGRSFWILNDLSRLRQLNDGVVSSEVYLFQPGNAHSARGYEPVVNYYLRDKPGDEITLDFLDPDGKIIRTFSSKRETIDAGRAPRSGDSGRRPLSARRGMNRFVWDMRYPGAVEINGGTFLMGGSLRGPLAPPGVYRVRLTARGKSQAQSFEIRGNPEFPATGEDYRRQFDLLTAIRNKLSLTHEAVNTILDLSDSIEGDLATLEKRRDKQDAVEAGRRLKIRLSELLNELVEMRFQGHDDQTLVNPLKLNNRIASLQSCAGTDTGPTEQCYKNFEELVRELDEHLSKLKEITDKDLPNFNNLKRN